MNDRRDASSGNRDGQGTGPGPRRPPDTPPDASAGGRFGGGHGEPGYRGDSPRYTPPGSVGGGSYGGGGGYSQGGYDQGNFDPAVEGYRMARERGRGGPRGPWRQAGRTEYAGDRPAQSSHDPTGDWRQGYGSYGLSEGGGEEAQGLGAGDSMYGRHAYEGEPAGGYGFGSDVGEGRPRGQVEGTEGGWGRPDRGSQHGAGWRGEPRWQQDARDARDDRGGSVPWPYLEPWAVPGPHTGRGPQDWERPSESIRNDVCERLTRHGELDASRIRVLVENGEVILEGRVESRVAKRMAEDTAETVAGVRDVQNRLRIDYGDER